MFFIFLVVFVVIGSFPATWLLMLFLGNCGLTQVGFWGSLPAGILITFFVAGGGLWRADRWSSS